MVSFSTILKLDAKLRAARIPIDGVRIGDDDTIVVDYRESATRQQIEAGELIASQFNVRLQYAKEIKLDELCVWWDTKLQEGVIPQGHSFSLACTPDDIALLTAVYVMAKASIEAGVKTPLDTFMILDTEGGVHLFTIVELTGVLLSYGDKRTALATLYIGYSQAIEAATTVAEVEAIIIGA